MPDEERNPWALLACSVSLTSLGYAYRYAEVESQAFAQLYFRWGLYEETAEGVVLALQGALVLALLAAPFRKLHWLTLPALCALLFELCCTVVNPSAVHPSLSIPNQALRLSPFVLLWMPFRHGTVIGVLGEWFLGSCNA